MHDPAVSTDDLPPAPTLPSCGDLTLHVRLQIADMFGDIASFWGFTRTQGRVYGLLFLSPIPLDHSSVREQLGVSAGSASMTLASLAEWGAVVRHNRTYTAQTNLWKLITKVMRHREYPKVTAAARRLRELAEELREAGDNSETRFMRARIDHLCRFFDTCRAFLDALVEHTPVHGILNTLVRRAARFERSL